MLTFEQMLDGLTVDVAPFALCEVRGGGLLDMGSRDQATLHYVLSGSGVFDIAAWPGLRVDAGTVVIAPAATPHRLSAVPGAECEALRCSSIGPDWDLKSTGEGADGIIVACAEIKATYREIDGLFDYLHEPLITDLAGHDSLRLALGQILDELASPKPGARALVRALMQQCMIHILREHMDAGSSAITWMAAAQDDRLWTAVRAIFEHPDDAHTLESLADAAAMSRSAFAEHFKAAFGRGPIDFVREVRLKLASRLLVTTDMPVKTITRNVGYTSRSYFSRAFHEAYGCSPAEYRSDHRAAG